MFLCACLLKFPDLVGYVCSMSYVRVATIAYLTTHELNPTILDLCPTNALAPTARAVLVWEIVLQHFVLRCPPLWRPNK